MARGINKVILVGNVGADPDVRYLPNGNAVTTLSVATSETWKDKTTGEKQDRTEWHRVVCFNRLGEIAGEYIRKGSKLYVEGSLRTRKWQDQQAKIDIQLKLLRLTFKCSIAKEVVPLITTTCLHFREPLPLNKLQQKIKQLQHLLHKMLLMN